MEEISFLDAEDYGALSDAAESTEETTEETNAEPVTEEAVTPSTEPTPQKYKVKVNKEEKELTLDELIANAQKGMDYDRVKGQVEQLRNDPARALLERKAKEANMPLEQYVDFLSKAEQQQKIEDRTQQLIEEGYEEKAAAKIAQLELEGNSLKSTVDNLSQQTKTQEEQQAKLQKDLADFTRMFPDVQEFPPEVVADINDGMSPVTAYLKFQNEQKDKELAALKQNTKNKELDTGSVQSQKDTEQDPFLGGLFGT